MMKTWGTWLGIEDDTEADAQDSESEEEGDGRGDGGETALGPDPLTALGADPLTALGADPLTALLLQRARGLGGYIYNVASDASKKLSVSLVETAQSLRRSVEEGHIDGIIDKTILGEFRKEQEKFVQEKNANQFGVAVPPWVGFNDEENLQQQILALSADKRNFLREPPAGIRFPFDFQQMSPVAMAMLEEDELLRKMRFHLVPKQMTEEAFWRNYFYRVSLIKQSAQISMLAAQRPQTPETRDQPDLDQHKEDDVVPDWEKELQQELQEYQVVAGAENHGDRWDKELEDMLREDI